MMSTNLKAFLDMTSHSEGVADLGHNDGYDILFGSKPGRIRRIDDLIGSPHNFGHPRITIEWGDDPNDWSSAAGRYQAIWPTWADAAKHIGLVDFTPASQDRFAKYRIEVRGALQMIEKGEIVDAIHACSKEWASFPGANYAGQGMRDLDFLVQAYRDAGGHVA